MLLYLATDTDNKNDDKKLEAWLKAVELRYEDPGLYKDVARIYVRKEQYDKALDMLDLCSIYE